MMEDEFPKCSFAFVRVSSKHSKKISKMTKSMKKNMNFLVLFSDRTRLASWFLFAVILIIVIVYMAFSAQTA